AAAVARIDVADLGVEVPARQRHEAGQLGAADARFVDVDQGEVDVVADQFFDVGLEGVEGPVPALAELRDAEVQRLRLLGLEVRIAPAAGVVQVVEGRHLEAGAGAGGETETLAELQPVAEAAG